MLLSKLRKDQLGATAVEYGIMVAAIAAVIIAIVFVVGLQMQGAFSLIIDGMPRCVQVGSNCKQ